MSDSGRQVELRLERVARDRLAHRPRPITPIRIITWFRSGGGALEAAGVGVVARSFVLRNLWIRTEQARRSNSRGRGRVVGVLGGNDVSWGDALLDPRLQRG